MEWRAFERVSGPLLLTERMDNAASFIAYVQAAIQGVRIGGRRPRLRDFEIDWDPRPKAEADIAAELGAALEAAASQPSPHSSSTSSATPQG